MYEIKLSNAFEYKFPESGRVKTNEEAAQYQNLLEHLLKNSYVLDSDIYFSVFLYKLLKIIPYRNIAYNIAGGIQEIIIKKERMFPCRYLGVRRDSARHLVLLIPTLKEYIKEIEDRPMYSIRHLVENWPAIVSGKQTR